MKKQIGKNLTGMKTNNSEESLSISDHSSSDEEIKIQKEDQKEISAVQDKFQTAQDKIKI